MTLLKKFLIVRFLVPVLFLAGSAALLHSSENPATERYSHEKLSQIAYGDLVAILEGDSAQTRQIITDRVRAIFGEEAICTEIPVKDRPDLVNLIVQIPATSGYAKKPGIFLNAHLDTIEPHKTTILYQGVAKDDYKFSALDDRAGVASIVIAARLLKQRWDAESLAHGPVILVFTDLEERGSAGAKDLVENHRGYFENFGIMLTIDGPLIYRGDKDLPDLDAVGKENPFVLADPDFSEEKDYYRAIYDAVAKVQYKKYRTPRLCRDDGMGDHYAFRRNGFNPVVNIRAPHTGLHSPEEQTIVEDQLVPVAQWLAECVIDLGKTFEGEP